MDKSNLRAACSIIKERNLRGSKVRIGSSDFFCNDFMGEAFSLSSVPIVQDHAFHYGSSRAKAPSKPREHPSSTLNSKQDR